MAVEQIPPPAAANTGSAPKITFGDRGLVNLTMALRGLTANKLRAFLTMLGVIIGVGAVIIAIAIGQGSRAAVAASLQKLGTNVLTVFPGQQRTGGVSGGLGSTNTMTLADADAQAASDRRQEMFAGRPRLFGRFRHRVGGPNRAGHPASRDGTAAGASATMPG